MIILDTTLKSLEIILPGAITTNQLPWTTAYVTNGAATPLVETDGLTNSGTAVTLVAAPGASQQQIVKHLSVNNADTVSQKVTIRLNNNGTFRNIYVVTLAVGDNLIYTAEGEFQVFDLNGNVKQSLLALPLAAGSGGTGASSLTAHGVVIGEGTSAVAVTAVGATNTVLHGNTGADPTYSAVVEADITLANNTTNNVSTAKHGLAPILPNDATKYLDGTGAYSVPAGSPPVSRYVCTVANADNTAVETTVISFSVPANEMTDKSVLLVDFFIIARNPGPGAVTPAIKVKWGATSVTTGAVAWSNGNVDNLTYARLAMIRVSADLYIHDAKGTNISGYAVEGMWGTDLGSTNANSQNALKMTAPDFTTTQTVVMTVQWSSAVVNLYYKVLSAIALRIQN